MLCSTKPSGNPPRSGRCDHPDLHKRSAMERGRPAAIARNETLRAARHYGWAFWKRWTGYLAQSRIEAKLRCLKTFEERIAARAPDRQTAEIQIRVALMNRFFALRIVEIIRVTSQQRGEGHHAPRGSCTTTSWLKLWPPLPTTKSNASTNCALRTQMEWQSGRTLTEEVGLPSGLLHPNWQNGRVYVFRSAFRRVLPIRQRESRRRSERSAPNRSESAYSLPVAA